MLTALGLVVAVLAAPSPGCRRLVSGEGRPLATWDTACRWGKLLVKKEGLEVTESSCDWIYPKEDWQPPQPYISYPSANEEETYTVVVLDPDAPNHPDGTYYLHMMQANIKGRDLKAGDFSKADTIASYVGPAPPPGTGEHRYMFVVYRHRPGFVVQSQPTPERWMFDFRKWLADFGKGLEGPEAGVQFRAGP